MAPDDTPWTDHRMSAERVTDTLSQADTGPANVPDRYTALELQSGEVVIYDCEDATAWIQSTGACPVEETI